jgi:hypothetical protein
MSDTVPWERKLDPYSRLQAEDGLLTDGAEVTVRLARPDVAMAQQVEEAGLKLHAKVGDILVGHVVDSAGLKHIAELDFVREVQLARPLYPDRPNPAGQENAHE